MADYSWIARSGQGVPNLVDAYQRGQEGTMRRNALAAQIAQAEAEREHQAAVRPMQRNLLAEQVAAAEQQRRQVETQEAARRQFAASLQTPEMIARPDMQNYLAGLLAETGDTKGAVGLAYPELSSAAPAELRTFRELTSGMSPEDVERARRVALGLESRAPSAGAKTVKVRGSDGRERIGVFDPVSRSLNISTEQGWVPAGPGDHILGLAAQFDPQTLISRSPEEQAALTRQAETNVTPPKDMYLREPGNPAAGAVPIPDGPVDVERRQAEQSRQQRQAQREAYADIVTQDIDRAIEAIESARVPMTGFAGSSLSRIPGTPQHDLAALIETVKANIGFDRLQQMREASPTGGALGQVSNFENRLLQATAGNLEMTQSPEQLTRNLRRVQEIYRRIIHEGITPDQALEEGLMPGMEENDIDALLRKYGGQ